MLVNIAYMHCADTFSPTRKATPQRLRRIGASLLFEEERRGGPRDAFLDLRPNTAENDSSKGLGRLGRLGGLGGLGGLGNDPSSVVLENPQVAGSSSLFSRLQHARPLQSVDMLGS